MKLLFLSDLNNIHTKKWISALSQHNIEILAFGLSAPTDDFYIKYPNVKLIYSNFTGLYGDSKLSKIKYLKVLPQLKKAYKTFKPDIVHAHYSTSYGLLGALLKHNPYLISVWGEDVFSFPRESKMKYILFKWILKKADYIFSTSEIMAVETSLYTDKKVEVVPFGVDMDFFKPISTVEKPKNDITIGIVKTLEPKYGIKYLIEAFDIIKKKYNSYKLKLIIVGSGSKEEELKQQVKNLGLENQIEFTGRVDHHKVPEYFNKMDIVVVPSVKRGESFGVAAVEASSCEKAVIVSNIGGLPEVIINNKTGLLSEPKNSQDIADKISFLIDQPEKRFEMGKAGRFNVEEKYKWEDNVRLMITHYKQILS